MANDNDIYKQVEGLHRENKARTYANVDSIDSMKMLNNRVLIKIDPTVYEKTNSGLFVETASYLNENNRFKPEFHAVRQGIVVKVPERYIYRENGIESHDTEIEVEIGDIVFFPLVESVNGDLIKCDDDFYLCINYETLHLAKRQVVLLTNSDNSIIVDGKLYEVIMLNGYLLCEPVYEETSKFAVEDKVKNKKLAKVVFSGNPVKYRDTKPMSIHSTTVDCRGYTDGKYVPSNAEVKNGDTIMISKAVQGAEVMLENDLHLHFDGKNNYRLVQRKYVDFIVNG